MTIQGQKKLRWNVEVGGVLREWVFLISPQWCQGPSTSDPWQWQSFVQVRLRETLSCKVFLWPNLSVYKWSTNVQNLAATASSSELPAAWDCSSAKTCYWHPLNPPSCPSVHQTHTSCIHVCKRNELSSQAAGTSPHSDHSPPHPSFSIPVSVWPSFLLSLSPS